LGVGLTTPHRKK